MVPAHPRQRASPMVYHRVYRTVADGSELCPSPLTDGPGELPSTPLSPPPQPISSNKRTTSTSTTSSKTDLSRQSQHTARIVCISDTHNLTPPVPPGDILVHAGDLTNQGSFSELQKQLLWLSSLPHEYKIIIAGNHDAVTLDSAFHAEYHSYFKTPAPESSARNIELMNSFTDRGVVYLCDEEKKLVLKDGRRIHIYGSPWTLKTGLYGFQIRDDEHAQEIWEKIPSGVDILLTHSPARYFLDSQRYPGCDVLRSTVEMKRPRVHVFGHVHASRGVMRVKWEEQNGNVSKVINASCEMVDDDKPEKKTIFKVDLRGSKTRNETCLVNAAMKQQGSKAVVLVLDVAGGGHKVE